MTKHPDKKSKPPQKYKTQITNLGTYLTGRPTKLNRKTVLKIKEFYENYEPYYEVPVEKQTKDGAVVTEMKESPSGLPNPKKLADFLGVTRTTIYYWIRKYPEFSNMYKRLRDSVSKEIVVENALLGNYNAQFAKSYMENELDWREQNTEKQAPKQVFTQQINYFLAQQGVPAIPDQTLENGPKKAILPAFDDE